MTWRNEEDLDLKASTEDTSQLQKLSVEVTKKASAPKDAFSLSFQDNLQGHVMEKKKWSWKNSTALYLTNQSRRYKTAYSLFYY